MKILKFVGIFLGVLIVLLLAGTLFLPSESHVERSITINAAPQAIFSEINNFQNMNNWSPWHKIDPATEYSFEGNQAGTGAKMSWKSDHRDVGSGSQEIVESIPNEFVKSKLVFEGFDDPADATFLLEPSGDQTKVTWTFDSNMSGLYKYFGLAMDDMLGPMYETGLQNLKEIAEAKPAYRSEIGLEKVEPIAYLGILETITTDQPDQISEIMGQLYGELMAYMDENDIAQAGPPMTVYPSWSETQFEMECALPVDEEINVSGDRINYQTTTAGTAVKAVHMGDYKGLEGAHQEINRYVEENGLNGAGSPYEVYITDPGEERDTSKWITHIYYPVED